MLLTITKYIICAFATCYNETVIEQRRYTSEVPNPHEVQQDWSTLLDHFTPAHEDAQDDVREIWDNLTRLWTRDWETVGENLLKAMMEVSRRYSGDELAQTVRLIATTNAKFPRADAVKYLIHLFPQQDVGNEVMERFVQICEEQRLAEQKEVQEIVALQHSFVASHAWAFIKAFRDWVSRPLRRK